MNEDDRPTFGEHLLWTLEGAGLMSAALIGVMLVLIGLAGIVE